MKVRRGIGQVIAGERVLAALPPLGPYVSAAANESQPRKRLHFFAGRALSHVALTDEQRSHMYDAARLARAVAPGVIDGFEVALEGTQLVIMPGHALTEAGEDIELHYPLRIQPDVVPIDSACITERLAPEGNADDDAIRVRLTQGERFTLGTLRGLARLDLVPHALVLVAQPLTIALDRTGELDSPCPNAVNEGAYSQLAWEDGFRLVWVSWPNDTSLPPWTSDGTAVDPLFRNRLAYAVFNEEQRHADRAARMRRLRLRRGVETAALGIAGIEAQLTSLALQERAWPWSRLGAPLVVIGFDGGFQPAFADRNAVVRQGGGRANRAPLAPFVGEDVLWQARVAQLIEHLAEVPPEQRRAESLVKLLDWLPPAGVLPRDAVDIAANRQFVFPASYDVQAQPIPIDMVDALIAESSSMAPYNLSVRDAVQILVPVPARFFDPDLLKLDERIHPLFDAEVARLERLRTSTLVQRDRLRRRFDMLSHAVTGRLPLYPLDDPDALPDETGALDATAFARLHRTVFAAGETVAHGFKKAQFYLELAASDELFVFVRLDTKPAAITLQAFVGDTAKKLILWGSSQVPAGAVNAGALPADSGWVRLSVPIAAAELSATRIDGLVFGVIADAAAGEVQWGYAGKTGNGYESYWVSDALPQGATVEGAWEWHAQGEPSADGGVADAANGVSVNGDVRSSAEVDTLIASYTAYRNGVLKGELGLPTVTKDPAGLDVVTPSPNAPLAGAGLDELIGRLDARIAAANDHIEFGFLRARTDIYRIRQNVLGVGSAGRLLTSPTAAELITRNDNPVATEKDFADYFKRAAETQTPAPSGLVLPLAAAQPLAPATSTVSRATAISAARATPIVSALGLNVRAPSTILGAGLGGRAIAGVAEPIAPTMLAAAVRAGTVSADAARTTLLGADVAKFAIDTGPTVKEVTGTSLYGATLNTVMVGERLTGSAAVVAKNAAASGKSDFVRTGVNLLAEKGLAVDDLPVFGYKAKEGVTAAASAKSLIAGQLDDTDAQEVTGEDLAESVYFQRGLDAIDNLVRFLRGVEVRIDDYKRLQIDVVAARTRVLAALQRIETQLAALATALAEARHDLSVARALRAEEIQRVAALIARRVAILAQQVPYVVFRRPRSTKVLLDAPVHVVQPAVIDDPVPRCRQETHDVPPELQAMVDTLKDVPAAWLRKLQPLILKFDRIDSLQTLIGTAAQRIATAAARTPLALSESPQTKTGMLLSNALQRQAQRVDLAVQKQATSLSLVKADTWKSVVQSAVGTVSATDLIQSGASNRRITLEATGELDDIAGVASCLYNAFCGVPPVTRLQWAERFSQVDPDVSLRVLTVLPGFGDERLGVDYITWKQMQRMVDWLFSRVADEPDAIAAINDLVQVAMLLSAHAPVRRIISARVRKPVRPVLDGRLDLAIDPKLVRIGMQVLVHAPTGNTPVARAVVADLAADGVVARISQVMQPAMLIDTNMRVQLQSGPPLTTPGTAMRDAAKAVAFMK